MFEVINRIQLTFFDIIMQMVAPFVDLILQKANQKREDELKQLILRREQLASSNYAKNIPMRSYMVRRKGTVFRDTVIFKTFNETLFSLNEELKKHGK